MNSSQFSKILFIQALEQSDPQAQHIPYSRRQRATQKAKNLISQSRPSSPESATQFVTHRAESLWNFLSSSYPRMTESFHGAEANLPSFLVGVPALAVGLFINGLGPSQRVNLLNFPLLLLLLWNMGVYTWTLSLLLLRKDLTGPLLRSVSLGVTKLANMAGKGPWPNTATALWGSTSREWALQAAERFMNLWWKQAYPLLINRVRHLLHLGAACLALGIILSMYFRGLVLDYQATWESTFLTPVQVHGVLQGLLKPAAWLLNFPFPGVEDIAKLQAPSHGSAATWIHMWALTGLTGIVLPRVLLALVSARLAKKATESFTLPLDDPYYLQLLAPDRGQGIQIDIVPYSYQPSPAASEFIGKCLLDLVGNQATLRWREPHPYGQENLPWLKSDTSHQMVVLLCNLAQTPEKEVHGEVLRVLQSHMDISQGSHQLLLMLDQEAYRHMADPEHRLERQKTWQRLADDYHLRIVPFEPNESSCDQLLQMAQTALYPQKAT